MSALVALALSCVVLGAFAVLALVADVAQLIIDAVPPLRDAFERFYRSLPMSEDDWDA